MVTDILNNYSTMSKSEVDIGTVLLTRLQILFSFYHFLYVCIYVFSVCVSPEWQSDWSRDTLMS